VPGLPRLLALPPLPPEVITAILGDLAPRVQVVLPRERTLQAVQAAIADVDLVLGTWQGTDPLPVTAEVVAAASDRLVFVQQPTVGVDSLDVAALTARGVVLANAAGANSRAVAEWCLAGALAVARSLVWAHEQVRAGRWPQLEIATRGSSEIASLRIGILGMGSIGTEVARLFTIFGGTVRYWSRRQRPLEQTHGATWLPLEELLACSDLVICVLPLTAQTAGLLGARQLGLLPAGAMVVDAGRGGVLDTEALLVALDSGRLRGAALDVHPLEPLPLEHPLRHHERVVLSPHAAGGSAQATLAMFAQSVDNLRRVLDGQPVQAVVNDLGPLVRLRGAGSS
jgi:D-3-phosphoglycerate dehydrogenase